MLIVEAPSSALQIRTTIKDGGVLELSLDEAQVREPDADEVVVRVEAAPLNPSDLALLLGTAEVSTATASSRGDHPIVKMEVPAAAMPAMENRMGVSFGVGNEGAGVVIAAGGSDAAQALLGKTVSCRGGELYAQYRTLNVNQCSALPDGITPKEGASSFTNPLTVLCMIETMRREGHTGLVHTAAASNLGQMLNRACLADGISLVNIVRKPEQEKLLRDQGATHVVNSSSPDFTEELVTALQETGSTLGFDAVGGGSLAGQIVEAMEVAVGRNMPEYSRYGSTQHKQVYIYGRLDFGETIFPFNLGMAWGVGGWLLTHNLAAIGPERTAELRARVAAELKTTFASSYTAEISLTEMLQIPMIQAYARKATGEKFLINPNK